MRNLWVQSSGISNTQNESELFRVSHNVEHVALLSASLRSLAASIRAYSAIRHRRFALDSSYPPPAFANLHSITVIEENHSYHWQFLLGIDLGAGTLLLNNVTRLRLHVLSSFGFVPHKFLPNLTHLALPFLHLGNDYRRDGVVPRLPSGVLEHRALQMIVLTVAEERWFASPWYQIARFSNTGFQVGKPAGSHRATFSQLVQRARRTDDRIHVLWSPPMGDSVCQEWAGAARGGYSLWERAAIARTEDWYGADLPDTYPKIPSR